MDNLRFGMLLGLATPHHNIEIALECLIKLRIMANSADCIGLKVYRIVELICQHIQYEDDDGIEEEPNELLSIGNTKITARKLKLNSSRNKRKNDPTNNSSGKKKKVSRTTLPLQISNTNTFTVTKLCNFCKICYLNTINNRTRIAACWRDSQHEVVRLMNARYLRSVQQQSLQRNTNHQHHYHQHQYHYHQHNYNEKYRPEWKQRRQPWFNQFLSRKKLWGNISC